MERFAYADDTTLADASTTPQERVVTPHSRALALVPFGVGQFQNGQIQRGAGMFFLIAESALVVTAAVTLPIYFSDVSYRSAAYRSGDLAAESSASDHVRAMGAANAAVLGSLALAAIVGIVHAQATFVPEEVESRPRAQPAPSLSQSASVTGHGLTLGLTATF